jgi:hypothetical protein
MSWLGKILTFVVLIASVVWVYFTVGAYATRTNWKVRADAFEKAAKDSEASREREMRDNQAAREALVRLYAAEKTRAEELEKKYAEEAAAGRKTDADYKEILKGLREDGMKAETRDARIQTIQVELADLRKRNDGLENDRVKLVILKEQAERERVRAENESRLARSQAEENARKVESLTTQVAELRQTGGTGSGAVARSIEKIPAPLPENIRGTVTRDMAENLVQINIGIDAGLEPGSRLDVYRESGGGKYLGTLVVTKSVYPKQAVGVFQPARLVPVSQLRPDELPRKGDTVGHVATGDGPRTDRIGR